MPARTLPGPLDGAGFRGKSRSLTVLPGGASWETCRNCGSTLHPSRRESSKVRTIVGAALNVDTYRCKCSTGCQVHRPLEVAA
jgi:hypothetical protein